MTKKGQLLEEPKTQDEQSDPSVIHIVFEGLGTADPQISFTNVRPTQVLIAAEVLKFEATEMFRAIRAQQAAERMQNRADMANIMASINRPKGRPS